jgi:hypothetical protein
MGCERGNGVRIASLELGKSIQIAFGRGVFELSAAKRLEHTKRLGLPTQK